MFRVDTQAKHDFAHLRSGDLHVEVVDLLLRVGDLALHVVLLVRVFDERLLELLLRGHRVGQVAAQLRANLVDDGFLARCIAGRGGARPG